MDILRGLPIKFNSPRHLSLYRKISNPYSLPEVSERNIKLHLSMRYSLYLIDEILED